MNKTYSENEYIFPHIIIDNILIQNITCTHRCTHGEKVWCGLKKDEKLMNSIVCTNTEDYYYYRKLAYDTNGYIGAFVRKNPKLLIDMAFGC